MNPQEVTTYECPYRKSCTINKDVNRCNTPRHLDCTIYQKYETFSRQLNIRKNVEGETNLNPDGASHIPADSYNLGIGTIVEEDLRRLK